MLRTPRILSLALILLSCGFVTRAQADILYSNTATFTGFAYSPGGAAADGATATSASTAMLADDIKVGSGYAGTAVTSVTFSVANLNSVAVSANVDLRFYSVGTNGGPGTLLGGLNFSAISFSAGAIQLFTYTSASTLFTVPTSGSFFVGEFFTNDSATATTAQLNNLGIGVFNPPTVGTSADSFFMTSAGGSTNSTSNPTGGFYNFGGSPVANFGFSFSGTPAVTPVPEPASLALLGLGLGLGTAGLARRRLR